MGTHHSAWAPGPGPGPSSTAKAGTRCAATATADDLQLPFGTVSPLQELLDELLQPQLGAGLSCRSLLQELVDLHHLPGPGAISYPSASACLPNHPLEEALASGGATWGTATPSVCSWSHGNT